MKPLIFILRQIESGFLWALYSPKLWFFIGVLALFFLLTGCAYNPYQQPHFDWHWKLVPTEELKHESVNYCAVYA